MSNGITSAGAKIGFSATAPAAETLVGYEALTFTETCEVTNLGDFGAETEVIKFTTICDGKVNKRMGPTDYGQSSLELAFDSDNAAQVILQTAADDRTPVYVRETLPLPDGATTADIYYYKAYVSSAKVMVGGANDYVRMAVNLEIDSKPILDAAA